MLKKINVIAVTIKTLLNNHIRPIEIAKKLKISKQRVNYWTKNEIKTVQHRKKKLRSDGINVRTYFQCLKVEQKQQLNQ